MTLPASSFTPRRQLLFPTPRTLLGQRARRCVSQSHRRSVTRSLPFARAAAACSAPLMHRQFPTLPASRRFQGGTATPFAPRLKDGLLLSQGRGSDHEGCPSGHTFLWGILWKCHCASCNSDERSVQRSARSGMVQPVMRSLRRNHGRPRINSTERKIRETVRAERSGGSGAEHGRPTAMRRTKNQRGAPGY